MARPGREKYQLEGLRIDVDHLHKERDQLCRELKEAKRTGCRVLQEAMGERDEARLERNEALRLLKDCGRLLDDGIANHEVEEGEDGYALVTLSAAAVLVTYIDDLIKRSAVEFLLSDKRLDAGEGG